MAFHCWLVKFHELQRVYQPELGCISSSLANDITDVSLSLPSSLSPDVRSKCLPKLATMEKELRLGQCYDALSSLRLHLHSRSRLLKDKYVNVWHQGPNTKSRELLGRLSARIATAASQYNTAYTALNVLDTDPKAHWRTELLILHEKDIRGISDPSLPDHQDPERASAILARSLLSGGVFPEGNHMPSWIWRGAHTSTDAVSGYNEGLSFFFGVFSVPHSTASSISTRVVKILCKEQMLA